MRTTQPSRFDNRIFLSQKLHIGIKIREEKSKNTYIITGVDEKESTEDSICYILNIPVWSFRHLHENTEFEIAGYRPEYKVELKETARVNPDKVDMYLENIREERKLEKEYREFKKTRDFNLTGLFAVDRQNFTHSYES